MPRPPGSPKTPGSGRKRGTVNKTRAISRDIAKSFVDNAEYRESLRQRLLAGTAGSVEMLLWQYAYGRPPITSDEGDGQPVSITITF